jgi:hypothetical protein
VQLTSTNSSIGLIYALKKFLNIVDNAKDQIIVLKILRLIFYENNR